MDLALDPQYQFNFLSADGRPYTRRNYWETLYAFSYGQVRILVAARVVPFSNLHEALYLAFHGERAEGVTQYLLPEAVNQSLLNLYRGETHDGFVENVTALVPDHPSQLPEEVLQKAEAALEETVSQELMRHGIQNGLGSFVAADADPFFARDDALQSIAGDREADALVRMSFQIDAAMKAQIRETLSDENADRALVRDDLEFDLARRLYSNPRYLAFVKRLVQTEGSYASPIVRDFLAFYTRCLNIRLREIGNRDHVDADVIAKRIEGFLGRERSRKTHHYLDYHDLTVLGAVLKGDLSEDREDPDRTGASYKVAPAIDRQSLLLREIGEPRFIVRKFIEHTFNVHHNVRNVQFIDEAETPKAPPENPFSDAFDRRLERVVKTVDAWLFANRDQLFNAAIGLVIIALIGALVIFLGAFFKMFG